MTPESLAESIEKCRFELMRGQHWADLRPSERETRVDLARRALVESGVAEELEAVQRQADRVPDLEALAARREAELAALDAQLAAERAAHADRVAELEAELAVVRQDRDRAEARLGATEAVVEAVRAIVSTPVPASGTEDPTAVGTTATAGGAVPTPATDSGAHGRRPVFRMAR